MHINGLTENLYGSPSGWFGSTSIIPLDFSDAAENAKMIVSEYSVVNGQVGLDAFTPNLTK